LLSLIDALTRILLRRKTYVENPINNVFYKLFRLLPKLTVQSEKSGGVSIAKIRIAKSNCSKVNQSTEKTAAEIISMYVCERK